MSSTLDEKDLKILALQEANADLNNRYIDLRVQYTIAMNELGGYQNEALSQKMPTVVEGELVEDD